MPVPPDAQDAQMIDIALPKEAVAVYEAWETIVENPDEWLMDMRGELAYVAGGGLPLVFGDEKSEIWQAMQAAMAENGGFITIAGINFSERGMSLLGNFYRFISKSGVKMHCIDERLADDLLSTKTEVHEHCGACAAAHAAIVAHLRKGVSVEDLLLSELGEEAVGKQKIYDTMPNHVALAVFVDFHGDEAVVDEAKRDHLRQQNALAFQVSLPVVLIEQFIKEAGLSDEDKALLLDVLVLWNVQIARNIIGGGHNDLQAHADHTLFIMDSRSVANNEIAQALYERMQLVQHAKELFISDAEDDLGQEVA